MVRSLYTIVQKRFQRKPRKQNLNDKSDDPNSDEKRIAVESLEDVTLSVYLTSVDLVEECHHHECVEDDGEVLSWSRSSKVRRLAVSIDSPAVNVEPCVP